MSEYERQGEALLRAVPVNEKVALLLRAADIHRERTGVHARLEIAANGVVLAWGVINTDRDEDRVRLSNSAGRQLNGNGSGELYPAAYLKKDVDDFCRGLWQAEIGRFDPQLMTGLPAAPPDCVLHPFILRGGGTVLFGPPGRGKSWITYLWAVSLDAGISTLWTVEQTRVLLINLERSADSVRRRIGAINVALGLPRDRAIRILNARGRTLDDVLAAAARYVEKHEVGAVMLDSISRAGMGDLTENLAANRITDRMNRLCPTWVGIAHTPRATDDHVFGSVHFDAGADVMAKLVSQQEQTGPLGIGLEVVKGNDLPRSWFKLQKFALEMSEEQGLVGVRKARDGEFPEVEAKRKVSALERLREWVLDQPYGRADATEAAEETGLNRSTVVQLFKNPEHFVELGKDGRRVLYGVRGTA